MKILPLILLLFASVAHGQYIATTFNPGATGTATPTLIQETVTPNDTLIANAISNASATNSIIFTCFLNSTQVGDKAVIKVRTGSTTANMSFTDDGSNTYTLEKSEVAGSVTSAIYDAPITTASRCVTLTFAATTGANTDQLILLEYNNLGAIDQTCAATVTSGTAPACGSMTTTVNGDLILDFTDVVTYSSTPSAFANGFTAQTGASWSLLDADALSWNAVQSEIQTTAGAVNPAITIAASTTRSNVVGIAYKATASGGSVASAPALLVQEIINGGNSAWGFSSTSSATAQTIQFPCPSNANQLVLLLGQGDAVTISHVGGSGSNTDNNGNTWNALTRNDSTGDTFALQYWYTTYPATCNGAEKVIVTYSASAAAQVPYWVFRALKASSGYDSSSTCSGASTGTGQCVVNSSSAGTGNITGATITPSAYPEIAISDQNQDFGSISAVSAGNFTAAYESVPGLTNGCSSVSTSKLCYQGVGFEQDMGAVNDVLASGSATFTWTYANTQNQGPDFYFSNAIAIK